MYIEYESLEQVNCQETKLTLRFSEGWYLPKGKGKWRWEK